MTADDAVRDGSAGAPLAVMAVIAAVTGPTNPAGAMITVTASSSYRHVVTAVIAVTCRSVTATAAHSNSHSVSH